jgi:hypothetical protein
MATPAPDLTRPKTPMRTSRHQRPRPRGRSRLLRPFPAGPRLRTVPRRGGPVRLPARSRQARDVPLLLSRHRGRLRAGRARLAAPGLHGPDPIGRARGASDGARHRGRRPAPAANLPGVPASVLRHLLARPDGAHARSRLSPRPGLTHHSRRGAATTPPRRRRMNTRLEAGVGELRSLGRCDPARAP